MDSTVARLVELVGVTGAQVGQLLAGPGQVVLVEPDVHSLTFVGQRGRPDDRPGRRSRRDHAQHRVFRGDLLDPCPQQGQRDETCSHMSTATRDGVGPVTLLEGSGGIAKDRHRVVFLRITEQPIGDDTYSQPHCPGGQPEPTTTVTMTQHAHTLEQRPGLMRRGVADEGSRGIGTPPHERTDQCGLIQQEPTDTSCGLWVDGMW